MGNKKTPSTKEKINLIEKLLHNLHFDMPHEQTKVGSEWWNLDISFQKFKEWSDKNLDEK